MAKLQYPLMGILGLIYIECACIGAYMFDNLDFVIHLSAIGF
ncbi:MAG: hypothetical protein ACJA1Z_001472 [Patiriisocius sp.]|jgi:hypothetical protein